MMRRTIMLLLATSGCTATPAPAAPAFPDRGRAGVVDAAHVLPAAAAHALNERVVAWDRRTGHQLVVATVPDMQGLDVKSYGYQLGRAWGLGRKGVDDGAILLLAAKERKVRIEVGYGLEPTLTDAATSAILRDVVVPRLKASDAPGALGAGADAIMAAVPADATADRDHRPVEHHSGLAGALAALAALIGATGAWWWATMARARRRHERMAAETKARIDDTRRQIESAVRPAAGRFRLDETPTSPPRAVRTSALYSNGRPVASQRSAMSSPPPPPPSPSPSVYVAPVIEPYRSSSSDSGGGSSFDWGSSSSGSSDSSSSSSGFDSGGGSFGGGGSDSSW